MKGARYDSCYTTPRGGGGGGGGHQQATVQHPLVCYQRQLENLSYRALQLALFKRLEPGNQLSREPYDPFPHLRASWQRARRNRTAFPTDAALQTHVLRLNAVLIRTFRQRHSCKMEAQSGRNVLGNRPHTHTHMPRRRRHTVAAEHGY